MTVKQLHIGLELGLQQLNSNLFNRLDPEGRDFILNSAIVDFVNSYINSDPSFSEYLVNNQIPIYSLVKSYVNPIYSRLGNQVVFNLPYANTVNEDGIVVQNGWLYDGVKYKVVAGVGEDLSDYGGSTVSSVGEEFVADFGYAAIAGTSISVNDNDTYIVENPGNIANGNQVLTPNHSYLQELTANVWFYNQVDTVIHRTSPVTQPRYKRIKAKLIEAVQLIPLTNNGLFHLLSIKSNIDTGNVLSGNVTFTKDKYYRVYSLGTGLVCPDLTSVGGYNGTNIGVVFRCTNTSTITLGTGVSVIETRYIPVRLIYSKDIEHIKEYSYSLTQESLIAEIKNNKVYVQCDSNTYINSIETTYIEEPCSVNYEYNVTTDLPTSVHNDIVTLAFNKATGQYAAKNFAAAGQLPQTEQKQ